MHTTDPATSTVQLKSVNTGNTHRDAQLRQDFAGYVNVTGNLTIRGANPNELHLQTSHPINRHTWHANWNGLTTALTHPQVALSISLTPPRRA